MNRIGFLKIYLMVVTVLSIVSFSLPLHAEELEKIKVAAILLVKGEVHVIDADGVQRDAQVSGPLHVGDRIETKNQSTLQVTFLDGSTMRLTANTDFTINDYRYVEGDANPKSDITVDNGLLGFMAGKISKIAPQNYKLHTETATIGIRGSGGEIHTSNGAGGQPVFTAMRTEAGHVLDVQTAFGNFIIDDPEVGLEVTQSAATLVPVPAGSWVEAAIEEEDEEGEASTSSDEESEGDTEDEEAEESGDEPSEDSDEESSEETSEGSVEEESSDETAEESTEDSQTEEAQAEETQTEESAEQPVEDESATATVEEQEETTETAPVEETQSKEEVAVEQEAAPEKEEVRVEESSAEPVLAETSAEPAVLTKEDTSTVLVADKSVAAVTAVDTVEKVEVATTVESPKVEAPTVDLGSLLEQTIQVVAETVEVVSTALTQDVSEDIIGISSTPEKEEIAVVEKEETLSKITTVPTIEVEEQKLAIDNTEDFTQSLNTQVIVEEADTVTNEVSNADISITTTEVNAVEVEETSVVTTTVVEDVASTSTNETNTSTSTQSYWASWYAEWQARYAYWRSTGEVDAGVKEWLADHGQEWATNEDAIRVTRGYTTWVDGEWLYGQRIYFNSNQVDDTVGVQSTAHSITLYRGTDLDQDVEYINRYAFYTPNIGGEHHSVSSLFYRLLPGYNSANIVSLPGLEGYDFINWGIWSSRLNQGQSATASTFGYYGVGDYADRTTLADRASYLANPANSALATYSGAAVGSVFGPSDAGDLIHGTATLNVNFENLNISGGINLGSNVIQLSNGAINSQTGTLQFQGSTIMNQANFSSGSFSGGFYGNQHNFAQEAAGTFSGFDGTKQAIGAFGVKKD